MYRSTNATAIVSVAPVQKTALTPGLLGGPGRERLRHVGARGDVARVLEAPGEDDLADGERHDQRVQPQDPDEEPVGQADEAPMPRQARIASASRSFDLGADAHDQASRNITPGVERSIPACMTTSIWPSAATARIVM